MTKTDKSGIATVTLTSQQAGNATVTAIVSSTSEMKAAPVTFTAGAISIAHSSSHLSSMDLVADGMTSTQVTVKVNDDNGNPLAGQSGKINLTAPNFSGLVLGQFSEVSNGVYTATISGTKAGEAEIVTEMDGTELTKQKLKLIADVRTAKIGELKPSKSGPVVVGDKVTYQATINDANDNLLGADIPVNWSVNRDTLVSGNPIMSLTNSAGVAEVEISRDMPGDALVTATVGRNSMSATAVNFASGSIDMSQSTANLLTKEITANSLDVATIQVDLRDSKGNPLANLQSQITTSPKSGEHGLDITTQANPSGGYLVNIKGYKAGSHVVTVSVAGKPFANTMNVKLVGDATKASLADVKVNRTTFKADNVDQVTYTATVVDVNNNPVENYPVSWRLVQGEGQYQSLSYTGPTGEAETKLSASRLGQYKMEAQVRLVAKVAPNVSTTAGDVVASQSNFVVDVNSIDASGNTKAKLTATLKDKFGNLLKGQTVNVKETQNLTGIKFSVNPMKDNGDGTYSTEVTSTTKGNTTFIASINSVDLTQQPQLLVGNIIPQLSFDNKNEKQTYRKAPLAKQALKGLPQSVIAHWSSDNSDVAKVDQVTGDIELLKAGVVNISAVTLADNTYAMGTASYQLEVERADPKLKFSQSLQNNEWGEKVAAYRPMADNADADINGLTLNWESDNSSVATINAQNGNITTIKPNTTQVTVKSAQDDRFKAGSATYVLVVNKKLIPIQFSQPMVQSKITDNISLQPLSGSTTAKVEWSSSDNNILKVDQNGSNLRVQNPGRVELTAKVAGNEYYLETSNRYVQEIYGKPEIKLAAIKPMSKGTISPDKRSWKPIFVGDNLVIDWSSLYTDKYRSPKDVTVEVIEESTGSRLASETISNRFDLQSTTIKYQSGWLDKRVKVRIISYGYQSIKGTDVDSQTIDIGRLKPTDIWRSAKLKRSFNLIITANNNDDSTCKDSHLGREHHANLMWGIDIKLDNELLEPMELTYSLNQKQLVNGSFKKEFNRSESPREKDTNASLKQECWTTHDGTPPNAILIKHAGDDTRYDVSDFSWYGGGRDVRTWFTRDIN